MPNTQVKETKKLMRERGICVVIPTYNNVESISDVIKDVQNYCMDVFVVNDGSTDGTEQKLRSIEGITLIDCSTNKGKGEALKLAFNKALQSGFAYAITLDADGQHYASDIPHFAKANTEHPGTIIIGCRNLENVDRSKGSNFANKFSNFWFFVQTGKKLDDTQTGYRLYPLKKLHGLSLLTSRYEAELELLVFASWGGVKIHPIPIEVYYPPQEKRVSHFRPVADFTRIFLLNTVLCFLAIVYGLPRHIARFVANAARTIYSLLLFVVFSLFIITPAVWLYLHIGKMTEKKRKDLHKLIYHAARFITLHHGIPGTHFSCSGKENADFNKPAVIICNHQSHLDLICKLIFSPKIIFLTKDWVWNNPFYGIIIRNAEYLPASNGIDQIMPHLRSLRDRGYSIAVYPEGTRSPDCRIGRFHKGAFYIAQQLQMDIQPILIYGPGKVLPKKGHCLRKAPLHVEFLSRVANNELQEKGNIAAQARFFHHCYIKEYARLCNRIEQNV